MEPWGGAEGVSFTSTIPPMSADKISSGTGESKFQRQWALWRKWNPFLLLRIYCMQSTSSSLKLLSDATINFRLINGNNSYILIPNVPTATRLSPNIPIITPGLMISHLPELFPRTAIQRKPAEIPPSFFNFPKCNVEHPRSLLKNLQCFLTAC